MQNNLRRLPQVLGAIAASAALAPSASACSSLAELDTYDRDQEYGYDRRTAADAQEILPTWVAEDARDIRLLQRTTGDERILTYQSQSQPPATCLQIKKTGKPSEAELVEALASDGHKTDSELADHVQQQAQTPLLAADWWPVGTEGKTTHLCGKWWVSVAGSHVYGYTPEMSAVADAIKKERDDQAQTRKN